MDAWPEKADPRGEDGRSPHSCRPATSVVRITPVLVRENVRLKNRKLHPQIDSNRLGMGLTAVFRSSVHTSKKLPFSPPLLLTLGGAATSNKWQPDGWSVVNGQR